MDKKFQEVCHSLDTVKLFINQYTALGDAHMVNYFVKDHWNTLLSNEMRKDLMKLSFEELYSLPGSLSDYLKKINKPFCTPTSTISPHVVPNLYQFIKEANQCRLNTFKSLTDRENLVSFLKVKQKKKEVEMDSSVDIQSKEFMCQKKSHEVAEMSPIIHQLCQFCNTNEVIDIGSGKGYLSSYLSLRYGLTVTGLESCETNSSGADERAKKYLNYWTKHLHDQSLSSDSNLKFSSITQHVGQESDLKLQKNESNCVVIGLHACGDLSSNIVHIFSRQPQVTGLCVVGCCYHHHTECKDCPNNAGFPMSHYLKNTKTKLGRNKRMLGLKAPEKTASSVPVDMLAKSERSMYYRAILTVILKDEFCIESDDIRVGKTFSKSKSFIDYVRKSLQKLRLDDDQLCDEAISKYLTRHEVHFKEIVAFCMIRQIYAPAIEALIVLDKLCYLMENASTAQISNCFISEIFNPVLSPRRFALVAVKA